MIILDYLNEVNIKQINKTYYFDFNLFNYDIL